MLKHEDNAVARLNGNNLQPLAGISVTVTDSATGLQASLYSDNGVTPLAQPLITNNDGYYGFYAPDGTYTLTFSGARINTFTRTIVLDDPKDNPYATVAGLAAPTGASSVGAAWFAGIVGKLSDLATSAGASLIGFIQAGAGAVSRSTQDKLRESNSIKDFGAKGDGLVDDLAAGTSAYAAGSEVTYPAGTYLFSAKPAGFNSKRRAGPGIVTLQGQGNVYPDSDILRYDPNGDAVTDYSVRLTRNRADLNTDPTKTGYYLYQNYTSSRVTSSLFGFAANIRRTGGGGKVVPAQLNGYALDGAITTVWGVATQASSGDDTTEPTGSTTLVGGEVAVISQYHDNSAKAIGLDTVFKNRYDNEAEVKHGTAGNNKFNLDSRAIQISSQVRPASGAYTGWSSGIYFKAGSLDQSTARKAVGIHMGDLDPATLSAAIKLPQGAGIVMGEPTGGAGQEDGIKYSTRKIEFWRDMNGASPLLRTWVDLSLSAPHGTVMAYHGVQTTIGAAGTAAPLPSAPAKYIKFTDINDGVTYAIPLYISL